MNMQKPLKCAAAVISAVLVYTGSTGIVSAETTLNGSDEDVVISSLAETASNSNSGSKSAETEWWKAEITDYDSSLSLISYELTPEASQTDNEKTDDKANEKEKNSNDENSSVKEKTETATVPSSDETDSNSASDSPEPVDVQASGEPVEEIPKAQSAPEVNAKSGEFAFVTYGWGHGVGMSQNGANFYAMYSGWSYQSILSHYYPGTTLMSTGTGGSETVKVNGSSTDALSAVAGIVYREIGSSMSTEAIKAQAVAVYTYIKYHGDSAKDLSAKANPPQNVIDACSSVIGQALYYDGSYALTMFCASSGGSTANCYEVFTDDIPYLRSVPSDYDADYDPHYGTVKYISSSEVKRLVEAKYGITLSGDPSNWFTLTAGDSGYITEVSIDGQVTVRGTEFKSMFGLKSSNFDISYAS